MAESLIALGVDIDLSTGDLALGPDGDLQLVAGAGLIQQKVYLSCVDLLQAALQRPFTPQNQARLQQQCQDRILALPEVATVGTVAASMPEPTVLDVGASVTLTSGLAQLVTVRATSLGSPIITTGSGF